MADEKDRVWPGRSHDVSRPQSIEEATRHYLERKREWDQRRDTLLEAEYAAWRKAARAREKAQKRRGGPEIIGPPNPYKPHRTR